MNKFKEAQQAFHELHPEYDTANGSTHIIHDKILNALVHASQLLDIHQKVKEDIEYLLRKLIGTDKTFDEIYNINLDFSVIIDRLKRLVGVT